MIVDKSCSVQPTNLPDALYVLATQFILVGLVVFVIYEWIG
jgi:hypothetical protein